MKNILLVNLRFKVDISFQKKESLGIAYISAVLKRHGHKVQMLDAQYFNMDIDEVCEKILSEEYDYIGFSLFEETVHFFKELYEKIKNKVKAHISLGGHFASFTAETLLKEFNRVNSIVVGEGELTTLELVENLESDDWKRISGIVYRENNDVVSTPKRDLIYDLDTLPYPDRDYYFANKDVDTATISASRGCYARCGFCSIQAFYGMLKGKIIRFRDPVKVVDEMEYVKQKYGIGNFFFADDNFYLQERFSLDGLIDSLMKSSKES